MNTVNLPEPDDADLIVVQDADTAGVPDSPIFESAGMPDAPAGVELGMRPEHVGRELTQDEIDEADGLGKYAPDAGEGRAESGTEEASTTDDATEPA